MTARYLSCPGRTCQRATLGNHGPPGLEVPRDTVQELQRVWRLGLNICWVYNHSAEKWKNALPETIRKWVQGPSPERAPSIFQWSGSISQN